MLYGLMRSENIAYFNGQTLFFCDKACQEIPGHRPLRYFTRLAGSADAYVRRPPGSGVRPPRFPSSTGVLLYSSPPQRGSSLAFQYGSAPRCQMPPLVGFSPNDATTPTRGCSCKRNVPNSDPPEQGRSSNGSPPLQGPFV